MRKKLVVVGNGMAAGRVLDELFEKSQDQYDVTVFGAEPRVNYNRIMLSPVLAGEKSFSDIVIHDEAWYEANSVALRRGETVAEIDRANRVVRTASGAMEPYDKLIVATGEAELPRLDELERRGQANGVKGLARVEPDEIAEIVARVGKLLAGRAIDLSDITLDMDRVGAFEAQAPSNDASSVASARCCSFKSISLEIPSVAVRMWRAGFTAWFRASLASSDMTVQRHDRRFFGPPLAFGNNRVGNSAVVGVSVIGRPDDLRGDGIRPRPIF